MIILPMRDHLKDAKVQQFACIAQWNSQIDFTNKGNIVDIGGIDSWPRRFIQLMPSFNIMDVQH